jgi:hypothetical protein
MATHQRRIDRVLAPAYLDGLDRRSLDEVRAMEAECTEIETEVSYVRRLAQARIDIVQAEIDRRAAGGGSLGGLSDRELVDALTEILADDGPRRPPAETRVTDSLAPSMEISWNRGLERLVADSTLASLPTLSADELQTTLEQLRALETEVSGKRHAIHAVMERLERDLAQRLAVGQA